MHWCLIGSVFNRTDPKLKRTPAHMLSCRLTPTPQQHTFVEEVFLGKPFFWSEAFCREASALCTFTLPALAVGPCLLRRLKLPFSSFSSCPPGHRILCALACLLACLLGWLLGRNDGWMVGGCVLLESLSVAERCLLVVQTTRPLPVAKQNQLASTLLARIRRLSWSFNLPIPVKQGA